MINGWKWGGFIVYAICAFQFSFSDWDLVWYAIGSLSCGIYIVSDRIVKP